MNVVTGAIGSLIFKLGNLLNEEFKLQKSVRKKMESLMKELDCAHAALRKIAGVPSDQLDEQVRIWAREIREASYDMEDLIDTFLVCIDGGHLEHSASQESFFRRLRGLMPTKLLERRKIVGAMDQINKRLEDVTRRYGRYTVSDSITVAKPTSIDPRLAAMYKEVTELVGIEKSSNELIAMLSPIGHDDETKMKMKMVSVVGVGGLGKTTLAKSVYDKLKVDFKCAAFVPVGRSPDFKEVFRDILRQTDKMKYEEHIQFYSQASVRQLIDELRETFQGNKRYLLVIDDIWDIKSWDTIKLAFVHRNSGSRVITTTRILDVAKETGEVYKLQHLPYDKSKNLFYTRIFGVEGKCPDKHLDEVSEKILKKCDGVPLAIITMASLLVGKSREEWVEVCNSIAFRDKDNMQVNDTEWILSLSYYDLPPHLKTCLLYLSVFPEDQVICKDSLIWMWLAEGFVQNDKPGISLFEIGNGYFNELINRSLIQAVESSEEDEMVVGCCVHDIVLDLLRLKSLENNFVTLLSNNAEASSSARRVRRLTHHYKMLDHIQMDLGHVRSFIAYGCDIDDGFSFRSFKLLRVLTLEHCNLGGDKNLVNLKNLENLLHLRYLGLRSSVIHEVPEEIGALKSLQTLDLEDIFVTREQLPTSVGQLTQLICLRARSMTAPNKVIEKLTSLEQLEIQACEDTVAHFVKELGMLRELKVLYATLATLDHSMQRDLVEALGNLHKIRQLELELDCFRPFLDQAMWATVALTPGLRRLTVRPICFYELPSPISSSGLPNITHLNLSVHYMEDQHLKMLSQLPELRHLKLQIESSNNAAKATVTSRTACPTTIADGCFQKLRSLCLPKSAVQFVHSEDSSILFVRNMYSRVSDFDTKRRDNCITVAPVVMPNLQVLEFEVYLKGRAKNGICDKLGLDCLPSLQRVKVTLWCVRSSAALFADDLEREEAALRKAIEGHPNRPTVQMHILGNSNLKRRMTS